MPVTNEFAILNRRHKMQDAIRTDHEFRDFSMEEIKEYEAKFKRFNLSGTGKLTLQELKLLMERIGEPQTRSGLDTLMQQIDKDEDGMISFREFMAIFQQAATGQLIKNSGVEILARKLKIGAEGFGVEGTKTIFEKKITAIRKSSKIEIEHDFRLEHEEKKRQLEEKKQKVEARKKSFKQLTSPFESI